jgi:hypothetical protein
VSGSPICKSVSPSSSAFIFLLSFFFVSLNGHIILFLLNVLLHITFSNQVIIIFYFWWYNGKPNSFPFK